MDLECSPRRCHLTRDLHFPFPSFSSMTGQHTRPRHLRIALHRELLLSLKSVASILIIRQLPFGFCRAMVSSHSLLLLDSVCTFLSFFSLYDRPAYSPKRERLIRDTFGMAAAAFIQQKTERKTKESLHALYIIGTLHTF